MSNDLLKAVFERSRTTGNARLVLLALADMADDNGECFPKISTLAARAGVGEQSVRHLLRVFERKGVITITKRFEGRRETSSLYRLIRDRLGMDAVAKADLDAVKPPTHRREPGTFKATMPYYPVHTPVNGVTPLKPSENMPCVPGNTPVTPYTPGGCVPVNTQGGVYGVTDESPEGTLIEPLAPAILVEPPVEPSNPPAAKPPKKLTPQQEMVGALADVMIMDAKIAGARLGKLASKLLKSGYTPTAIRTAYSRDGPYYREDWRGQKGQPPSDHTITDTVKRFAAEVAEETKIVIQDDGGTYV